MSVSNAPNPAGLAWPSAWIVFGAMDKSDPVLDAEVLNFGPRLPKWRAHTLPWHQRYHMGVALWNPANI